MARTKYTKRLNSHYDGATLDERGDLICPCGDLMKERPGDSPKFYRRHKAYQKGQCPNQIWFNGVDEVRDRLPTRTRGLAALRQAPVTPKRENAGIEVYLARTPVTAQGKTVSTITGMLGSSGQSRQSATSGGRPQWRAKEQVEYDLSENDQPPSPSPLSRQTRRHEEAGNHPQPRVLAPGLQRLNQSKRPAPSDSPEEPSRSKKLRSGSDNEDTRPPAGVGRALARGRKIRDVSRLNDDDIAVLKKRMEILPRFVDIIQVLKESGLV